MFRFGSVPDTPSKFTPVVPSKGFFFKFTLVREVIICRGDLFRGSYLLSSLSYRSHSGQCANYLPIRNCRDTTFAIFFYSSHIQPLFYILVLRIHQYRAPLQSCRFFGLHSQCLISVVFVFACLSRRKGRRSRRFDLATLIFPQQLTISTSPVHRTTMSVFVPFVNGSSAPTMAFPVAPFLQRIPRQQGLLCDSPGAYIRRLSLVPGIVALFLYSTLWSVNIYTLV